MLGDEFESKKKGTTPLFILLGTKVIRVFAIGELFLLLVVEQIPTLLLLFFLLLVATSIVLPINRPWKGGNIYDTSNLSQIFLNSVLFLLSTVLWFYGLSFLGPTRTLLSTDYLDVVLIYLGSILLGTKGNQSGKGTGMIMVVAAYGLLIWTSPTFTLLNTQQPTQSRIGSFFIILAVGLSLLQKKIGQDLETQIGSKRFYALLLPFSTALLFPFALFQAFTAEQNYTIFSFGTLLIIVVIAIVQFVLNFFVDIIVTHRKITLSIAAPSCLAASFVFGVIIEWWWGIAPFTFSTLISFGLLFVGTRILFTKDMPDIENKELPLYSQQIDIFSFSFLRISMRQILENYESRRIFSYLCVNLVFMFVEMLYGVLTNSLGLISDSCHMLFDCTALVIGLYASVISKLPSNKTFSYGYGRVEVLSGFINGIFLVFIAFLVLLESAERLYHPQEINSDKLLLVSCLGLAVNLVGVFAFHDLHGDHGDHGHSHSHGDKKSKEGHGHSHDEKKKEKKEEGHGHEHKKEGHSHSHGHSHKGENNSNLYGVYLHILADTLGSVGVITSSILIEWKGWTIADPICSLCISLLIFVSVIPLLSGSVTVLLQVTPEGYDKKLEKCLVDLRSVAGVVGWSDPHVWRHSGKTVVGTIHVQTTGEVPDQKILAQITSLFKTRGVNNITVEITHQPRSATS